MLLSCTATQIGGKQTAHMYLQGKSVALSAPKSLSASPGLPRLRMNARLSALYILQILVKDSNVVCVAEAAACFEALAKGLRKEFSTIAKAHFGTILDKLKDKSTNVCTQSAAACLTFHK